MDCFVKVQEPYSEYMNNSCDNLAFDFFLGPQNLTKSFCEVQVKTEDITHNQDINFYYQDIEKIILETLQRYLDLKISHHKEISALIQKLFKSSIYNDFRLKKLIKQRKIQLKRESAKKNVNIRKLKRKFVNSDFEMIDYEDENYMIKQYGQIVKIQDTLQQIEQLKSTNNSQSRLFISTQQCKQNQLQKKKKRNRVSAQISRDRKKLQFKCLESQNKRLKQIQFKFNKLKQDNLQGFSLNQSNNDIKIQLNDVLRRNSQLQIEVQRLRNLIDCSGNASIDFIDFQKNAQTHIFAQTLQGL